MALAGDTMRTSTREHMYAWIKAYMLKHQGHSPKYQEFIDNGLCSSTSQVFYHLQALEHEGLIARDRYRRIYMPGGAYKCKN